MDWLPRVDLSGGTLTLPLWAAAVAAAIIVALIVVAIVRSGLSDFGNLVFRVLVVAIAVGLGWTYIRTTGEHDSGDERRALDQRAADLVGRAIAPGSTIACLEAVSGDAVEGGCERAVFASPEALAAATAYMAARLSLLADAHDYATRRDTNYESSIAGLRRMIAADRFGLASQVLAARDGCTADACDGFNLVYDDKRLRANLRERTYDQIVARYAVNWPSRAYRPVASAVPPAPGTPPIVPPGPNVQFPSSQSIPPVSIMNAEPTAPPQVSAPAAAATAPAEVKETKETKAPPKRRRPAPDTAANNGNNGGNGAPMSLAPKQH
jgi:hypothetical protein